MPSVSYKPNVDLSKMRYFEILTYSMKPGHAGDFIKAAALVRDGYAKAGLGNPWAIYRAVIKVPTGTLYVFLPFSSLAMSTEVRPTAKRWDAHSGPIR